MVALLDVNVLVALFDPSHLHHEAAHEWFQSNRTHGWSTCPITENGFVRVVSHSAYPGRKTSVGDAIRRLRRFQQSGLHDFWPDSVSLRNESIFDPRRIGGPNQLTDVYLLALAVTNGGRLATFDTSIKLTVVTGASSASLVIITA